MFSQAPLSVIETSKSSDLGKASLILLNIRCSRFKDREDLVNRVEGLGLPTLSLGEAGAGVAR